MLRDITSAELGKRSAAAKAVEFVKTGMILGLGTGSTTSYFVDFLSERIAREGLEVLCVPTSKINIPNNNIFVKVFENESTSNVYVFFVFLETLIKIGSQ